MDESNYKKKKQYELLKYLTRERTKSLECEILAHNVRLATNASLKAVKDMDKSIIHLNLLYTNKS